MKKTFKILFMLIANIGFGQTAKVPNIKFSFTQVKDIRTLLGDKNSIAFYAEKKGNITKLSYAIYDLSTLQVSNYNGNPISNEDFIKLYEKMTLNKKIKFSDTDFGSIGIKTDSQGNAFIKRYNFMNVQLSTAEKKIYFLFLYAYKNKLKLKIAKSLTGKPLGGGGGVGEVTVMPAPPR